MKKLIAGLLMVVASLGVIALATPTPVAQARPCVLLSRRRDRVRRVL
jgi:hypothetical protein